MIRSRRAAAAGRHPSRSGAYVLLSGVAWGAIVTTFESLSQPPLDLSLSQYFLFYSRLLLHFSVSGALLAWLTAKISKLDRGAAAAIAAVPVVFAASATALLIDWLSVTFVPFWRDEPMSVIWRLSDLGPHMAWTFAVYGGLYMGAFFFLRNEALTRERLRVAELARIGADARMDRAVAEDTLPVVAPDLLVRALSELARRYDEEDERADRLMDKLVQLLRSASGAGAKTRGERNSDLGVRLGPLCRELERPPNVQLSANDRQ
jgi:hypothetical protein